MVQGVELSAYGYILLLSVTRVSVVNLYCKGRKRRDFL